MARKVIAVVSLPAVLKVPLVKYYKGIGKQWMIYMLAKQSENISVSVMAVGFLACWRRNHESISVGPELSFRKSYFVMLDLVNFCP